MQSNFKVCSNNGHKEIHFCKSGEVLTSNNFYKELEDIV